MVRVRMHIATKGFAWALGMLPDELTTNFPRSLTGNLPKFFWCDGYRIIRVVVEPTAVALAVALRGSTRNAHVEYGVVTRAFKNLNLSATATKLSPPSRRRRSGGLSFSEQSLD